MSFASAKRVCGVGLQSVRRGCIRWAVVLSLSGCGGLGSSGPPPKLFPIEEGMKQAPFWSDQLPHREDAQKLFEAASSYKGDLEKGVLFCLFHFPKTLTIHGRFVTREARLDPVVGVEAPDGKYLSQRFGFNEQEALLSVPLVDLKKGELWQMHIYDQGRLARDNWVATLKSTYNGELPFLFSQEDPKITAECRGIQKSAADTMVESEAKALSAQVKKAAASLPVKNNEADAGYQSGPIPALCKSAEQLAALVGWQDPKLTEPVNEVNGALTAWGKTLKASLPSLSEGASLPASEIFVKKISEDNQRGNITLDWENKGSGDVQVFATLSWLGASCSMAPPFEDDTPSPSTNPVVATPLKAGEHRSISYGYLAPCIIRKRELEVPRLLFFEVKRSGAVIESALFWLP